MILALLVATPVVAALLAYREATGDSYSRDLSIPSSGGSRIGVSFTFFAPPGSLPCDDETDEGTGMTDRIEGHGGELALAALRASGVGEMFTLSGGHVFPLYDAAYKSGFPIYDVRHEQSAVFAAEAVAKLQRRPGLAVLTAGPGVTNGISGLTSALLQRLAGAGDRRPGARRSAGARAACRRSTTSRWSPRSPSTPRRCSPPTRSRARSGPR